MTRVRPETRARAVLALLDPWLDRVDRGSGFGDVDPARSRSRLASLVRRVRACAGQGEHPDFEPLTLESGERYESAKNARKMAAIDALLVFARESRAPEISPAEVEAKTAEFTAAEDRALDDGSLFVQRLLESLPRRPFRSGSRRPRLRLVPPDGAEAEPLTPDQARALTDRVMGPS